MSKRTLKAYVHVGGTVYGPGDDVPADVAKEITNPNAWGGDDSTSDSTYTSMKVDELKAEIESRNENRADDAQLSTEGNKAALVAVLEADDLAHS